MYPYASINSSVASLSFGSESKLDEMYEMLSFSSVWYILTVAMPRSAILWIAVLKVSRRQETSYGTMRSSYIFWVAVCSSLTSRDSLITRLP